MLQPRRLRPLLLTLAAILAAGPATAQEAPAPPPQPTAPADSVPADPSPGDLVLLVFNDGNRVEGTFVRAEQAHVLVRIANVETPIARADLSALIVRASPAAEFRTLRAALKDTDTERRLDLALWARDKGLLDDALREIEDVVRLDPRQPDAPRIRDEIRSLIALRDRAAPDRPRPTQPEAPAAIAPTRPALGQFPLLTNDEINTIKVYEVDLVNPPRIVISRETIDRLLTRYADHPLIPQTRDAKEQFRALPPEKILEVMFRVRARDLYPEVRVNDNPESMKKFRDQVHSAWLINNCATTRCHGGSAAGRLLLTNRAPNAEPNFYTNFIILNNFVTAEGRPLLNWAEPEKSSLLQMGLPRDEATIAHPEVKGWTPVFRSREDRRYQQAIEWMKMMYRPRPEYPVAYPPKASEPPPAPTPR